MTVSIVSSLQEAEARAAETKSDLMKALETIVVLDFLEER